MVFNRTAIPFVPALAALLAVGCTKNIDDRDIVRIGSGEVRQALEEGAGTKSSRTLILDARTSDVYEKGHISGAMNLRAEQLRAAPKTGHVTDYKTVIVYGEDPASSSARALVKRLMLMEVEKVRWYAGGFREWSSLNLPSVKPGEPKPEAKSEARK